MTLLDLQGMEAPASSEAPTGGSSLTILGCESHKPSNLSVLLCH
ncbi:SapB/AmfS family lanthipeptide [Nonomuraea typhae]|nr:SapB/AmfS family lanthipeptide [Nonomuraea typhae]